MKIRTWLALGIGFTAGAATVYLLDPEHGEERRAEALTKGRARLEEQLDVDLRKQAQYLTDRAKGGFREALPDVGSATPNEATLAHKVESEVLGSADVNPGDIAVDAAEGVVTLRGEVADERQIRELVAATEAVQGVRAVRNLLHLPADPAPNQSRDT